MKQYYIYKIICLCDEWNGKFYIGKHYGKLDDNYTGSGKLIREYFKEYGKEKDITYEKIIIEIGDEFNICDLEREYIIEGLKSELCLNIRCASINQCKEARQKMSESLKGKIPWNKGKTGCYSEETKQKMSKVRKGKPKSDEHRKHMSVALKGQNNPMYGKKHSDETKHKMSEVAKRRWARN